MNCLRCGRETEEDRPFCDRCMKEMEKCPVRPGTAVMLPHRQETPPIKKGKRHAPPSSEEQIKSLKKQRNILRAVLCAVILLLLAVLILERAQPVKEYLRPGQNYSAVETTAETLEP